MAEPLDPYDAVLVLSFGGPEAPEEVVPFLERVTGGRGIPRERLEEVGQHYFARGGVSPINDESRALVAAVAGELRHRGSVLPVIWGNRHTEPFLTDALRAAYDNGARRVVTVLTSAFSSYSSCRQYREDLAEAVTTLAGEGREIAVDKIRPYAVSAGSVAAWTRALVSTCDLLQDPGTARLVFVTHSIPTAMNDTSGPGDSEGGRYLEQHRRLGLLLTEALERETGHALEAQLAYCSRSGPPSQPWLEPDIEDELVSLAGEGVREVVVAPIGFTSDHMEVVHDLDTAAAAVARDVGIRMLRVPTPRATPVYVSGLVDLLVERAAQARGESAVPVDADGAEPAPASCPAGCCPNLRVARLALCGQD